MTETQGSKGLLWRLRNQFPPKGMWNPPRGWRAKRTGNRWELVRFTRREYRRSLAFAAIGTVAALVAWLTVNLWNGWNSSNGAGWLLLAVFFLAYQVRTSHDMHPAIDDVGHSDAR